MLTPKAGYSACRLRAGTAGWLPMQSGGYATSLLRRPWVGARRVASRRQRRRWSPIKWLHAAELAGILQEVARGARLLYDGLLVHSLGEGQLYTAVNAHLDRPCITDAECLLRDLASTAALDMHGRSAAVLS